GSVRGVRRSAAWSPMEGACLRAGQCSGIFAGNARPAVHWRHEPLVRKSARLHRRLALAAASGGWPDRAADRPCLRRGLDRRRQGQRLVPRAGGRARGQRCRGRPGLPPPDVAVPPRQGGRRRAGAARAGRKARARDQRGLRPDQEPPPALTATRAWRHAGAIAASRTTIAGTRMQPPVIAPSILSANFARLGEEVDAVLAAGADWVHFDVMDNHYVPNLTIGPLVCEALRGHGVTAPIDVHLMVEPVDRLVPDFAKAGASLISFHPEASRHVHRTIQLIKAEGCQAGLVLNPGTPVQVLDYVLEELDLVLLMSVNPGFGGQAFIPSTLEKLRLVRERIDACGKVIRLEVDGGVKPDNIGEIAAAGADTFVAGSAIFGQPDYQAVVARMRDEIARTTGLRA